MSQSPSLSIIVISYNTKALVLECLESLYAQTSISFELLVVDNASEDGSAAAIAERFPQARLFAETKNHGFGAAHSIATRHAVGTHLLLLNPDTVVLEKSIDRLMAFAESKPSAGIWGGRTLYPDGRLNPSSCWRRMSLWSLFCQAVGLNKIFARSELFNPEAYGGWLRDYEREVDIVSGCFFMIRREIWDKLGGFDAKYKMYGEEADLCLRARKQLDVRPLISPNSVIIHYGGASERVPADKLVRLLKAKIQLINDHFPPYLQRPARFLMNLWAVSRHVGLKGALLVSKTSHLSKRSAIWAEVLARQSEWIDGHAQLSSTSPGGAPSV
ncbi:MAG: glycosyltransferase family 2 protein [Pseudomonadota bacterium]